MHVMRDVLGHVEHAELRKVDQHFRRGFRAWHELEYDFHAVDDALLRAPVDRARRRDQCYGAECIPFAETGIDVAAWTRRQEYAKLILGAPTLRRSCQHEFGRQGFHETRGSQYL